MAPDAEDIFPDEKPEESSTEVNDLVDGEASHVAVKVTCAETVDMELVQDRSLTQFEEEVSHTGEGQDYQEAC